MQRSQAEQRLAQRRADLAAAQAALQVRTDRLQTAEATLAALIADYQDRQRPERPHSQLAQARQQVETRQRQHARQAQVVAHLAKQIDATRMRSPWCRRRKPGYRPVCSVSSTRMRAIRRP